MKPIKHMETIVMMPPNKRYQDNWDAIFGKKEDVKALMNDIDEQARQECHRARDLGIDVASA